jgi:ectoine hydroxylase-related dioxygenase (phytanoyl-CoA dioxygenase family)
LKHDPAFRAVGGRALFAAIDAIFDGRSYRPPKDWGAFFIAFPGAEEWCVPHGGWHVDAHYASALWPARGVKTFALLGDVAPRGGGTQIVSGSHRLLHGWFRDNPPPAGARSAEMRRLLQAHPYVRDLHRPGPIEDRIARFHRQTEESDGIPLRVVEATGAAGDVILLHPLILHVAAPNTSSTPRLLLSGGVTTDMWGWGPPEP